jgi:hypothetical protein
MKLSKDQNVILFIVIAVLGGLLLFTGCAISNLNTEDKHKWMFGLGRHKLESGEEIESKIIDIKYKE